MDEGKRRGSGREIAKGGKQRGRPRESRALLSSPNRSAATTYGSHLRVSRSADDGRSLPLATVAPLPFHHDMGRAWIEGSRARTATDSAAGQSWSRHHFSFILPLPTLLVSSPLRPLPPAAVLPATKHSSGAPLPSRKASYFARLSALLRGRSGETAACHRLLSSCLFFLLFPLISCPLVFLARLSIPLL